MFCTGQLFVCQISMTQRNNRSMEMLKVSTAYVAEGEDDFAFAPFQSYDAK